MADHEQPIEERYRKDMNDLARSIDLSLNHGVQPKRTGFVLLMFSFDNKESDRMNYISNAQRLDVMKAMRELLDKWEKEMAQRN